MAELAKKGEDLLDQDPKLTMPIELSLLRTSWQQLQQQAAGQKVALQRAMTVQAQYEKMLEEYADFLETAQNKLKSEAVSAVDLEHLQQQLDTHKVSS